MNPYTDTHVTFEDLTASWPSTEAEMHRWIAAYRSAGHDPSAMLRSALEAFPGATGSMFAIALTKANRARGR